MKTWVAMGLVASLGLPAWSQDKPADEKSTKERLKEIKKILSSGQAQDQLNALHELGEILDPEALTMLISALNSTNDAIREAAAGAIGKFRHPSTPKAVWQAFGSAKSEDAQKVCIQALIDLDMCACIPYLNQLLNYNKRKYIDQALDALEKIGCAECLPALIELLKSAEAAATSSQNLPVGAGGGSYKGMSAMKMPANAPGVGAGTQGGDPKLAKLAPKIKQIISKIASRPFEKYKEWQAWLNAGGVAAIKLGGQYMCEATRQTYDVAAGKPAKCPNPDIKKTHKEILLKHIVEGEMVGAGGDAK